MENAMIGGRIGGLSSISTLSIEEAVEEEEDLAMSSEASSYTVDSCPELGLGLGRFDDEMFAYSSSSSPHKCSISYGAKRRAESAATGNQLSQVVGWPPVRSYRINSLCVQGKFAGNGEFNRDVCKSRSTKAVEEKEIGKLKHSLFVKVNMDGVPIGRKLDLNAHVCYESLANTLEEMFDIPKMGIERPVKEHLNVRLQGSQPPILSDRSQMFVLTYEDKDGDLMLVGDVPWGMFVHTVKRLRIMKISEAKGLSECIEMAAVF